MPTSCSRPATADGRPPPAYAPPTAPAQTATAPAITDEAPDRLTKLASLQERGVCPPTTSPAKRGRRPSACARAALPGGPPTGGAGGTPASGGPRKALG